MSEETSTELTSWKEIAARLQVSVRTAQLWEKERGLPVSRLPGKRGRVYLRESDLVAWLAGSDDTGDDDPGEPTDTGNGTAASSGPGPEAVAAARNPLRPTPAFVVFAVIVWTAIVIWAFRERAPEGGDPASWQIRPDTLVILDDMNHVVWTKSFPDGLREEPYSTNEIFHPVIDDIDGDGEAEVLFVPYVERAVEAPGLIAYDSDGTELWRHRPGLMVSTAREAFDDVYAVAGVQLLPQPDGTQDVILSAHHRLFYPNIVARLSSGGEVKARYWHAGHVANGPRRIAVADVDADSRSELLITGVNNARNAGTLIVLDPDDMDGAAYEPDIAYRFQELPVAREMARVFFPRSSLTPPEDRYTVAEAIVRGRTTITVSVAQILGQGPPRVLYTFGPDLRLLKVSAGDDFIGQFQLARQTGQLTHSLEQELAALEAIVYAESPLLGNASADSASPDRPN